MLSSKRKHDDDNDGITTIDPIIDCSFVSTKTIANILDTNSSSTMIKKRKKTTINKTKNVRFDDVTVYYFPRSQGFVSVPSQGTITLGMAQEHSNVEQYSIDDFSRHRHALHKSILRERKLLPPASAVESDNDDEPLPVDDFYFVQPIATRQRRTLLKQAGLVKLDSTEKYELTSIRRSREVCGCSCRRETGGCQPTSCECYLNDIACQVDRLTFPCPCATMLCKNPLGRLEFDQNKVRNHFLQTISRLKTEKELQQQNENFDDLSIVQSIISLIIESIEFEQNEISSLLYSLISSIEEPPMVIIPMSPPPSPIVVVNMLPLPASPPPSKENFGRTRSCRTPPRSTPRSSLRRKATTIISANSA